MPVRVTLTGVGMGTPGRPLHTSMPVLGGLDRTGAAATGGGGGGGGATTTGAGGGGGGGAASTTGSGVGSGAAATAATAGAEGAAGGAATAGTDGGAGGAGATSATTAGAEGGAGGAGATSSGSASRSSTWFRGTGSISSLGREARGAGREGSGAGMLRVLGLSTFASTTSRTLFLSSGTAGSRPLSRGSSSAARFRVEATSSSWGFEARSRIEGGMAGLDGAASVGLATARRLMTPGRIRSSTVSCVFCFSRWRLMRSTASASTELM